MTMTATVRPLTDATREERRAALIELADLVDTEDTYCAVKPLTPVLSRLVPALCSRKITDRQVALDLFNELVEAVAVRRRFCANEIDWLEAQGESTSERNRIATFDRMNAEVDTWADRLMGVTS